MPFTITPGIRSAIADTIQHIEENGRHLDVYAAAQTIQDRHAVDNVALEDIVAALVDLAAGRSLALEFSQPKFWGEVPVDVVVASQP